MISADKRLRIIHLAKLEFSAREIARRVAVSASTVSRVRRNNISKISKQVGGRRAKLSDRQRNWSLRQMVIGKTENTSQLKISLQNTFKISISNTSLRRVLKSGGLRAVAKRRKSYLLPRHKRARLNFAEKYKDWTIEDWKRVIFSDETKINRIVSDGREWI